MANEFRGIDPTGLAELASLLEHRSTAIDARARATVALLHSIPNTEPGAFAGPLHSVVGWANEEVANLRWRADAIRIGQSLEYGEGILDCSFEDIRDRALIAAFVPSRLDPDWVYQAWVAAKGVVAGRELGQRYIDGEEVSVDLYAMRYQVDFASIAAAFFNTIGDEPTARLPQTLRAAAWQGTQRGEDAAAAVQRYAHAFAAATRSGALEFTVDKLFTRDDPSAEVNEKYAAAALFTEPGIASDWLEPAVQRIVVGEPYVWWVTSPEAVAALMRGLANNPDIAAQALTEPHAVDRLLQRSSLVDDEIAAQVGEVLVLATTESADSQLAAGVAAATIAAIGTGAAHPHDAVLPPAAIVAGAYLDELAYSLADTAPDPTYSPRFQVSRATTRTFLRETMRNTAGHATILAATQLWIRNVLAPPNVTTFADYTTWVQNKTDDVGRLLGTLISADEAIAVEETAERRRRRAMLLDAVKALGQVGAAFTGPAEVALQPSIELLRRRAGELLDNDYANEISEDNQRLQEAILDELDVALHQIIGDLGLVDESEELDPQQVDLRKGAVRSTLRGLIAAELLAYRGTRSSDPG